MSWLGEDRINNIVMDWMSLLRTTYVLVNNVVHTPILTIMDEHILMT